MKPNTQTLTVLFKVINREAMNPLFDSLGKETEVLGCVVGAAGWGDLFQENEELKNRVAKLEELLEKNAIYDEEEE